MKKICKEQYEKDFKEMFKLDKNGLMTDIDCYVSNLENKINNLQSKIDKAIEYINADYVNGKVDGLSWLEVDKLLKILKEDK